MTATVGPAGDAVGRPLPSDDLGRRALPADVLVRRALAAGASAAAVLPPDQVVTAEWVRWKCLYGCDVAGRCRTCPPRSPSPDETRRLLDEYAVVSTSANAGWPLRVVATEGEPYHRYALLLVE